MRIHSDTITYADLLQAAREAQVGFTRLTQHGSRSRARAFDFTLTGSSGRRQNMGGPDEAATWDEWGIFLAHLYRVDPDMRTPYYADAEHFAFATSGRFDTLTHDQQHRNHKWTYPGVLYTNVCACGAMRNWLPRAETS